jgi:hypothetical protein
MGFMSKVKLSKETLDILANYASINPSIVVSAGNQLRTISNAEHILSKYTCAEEFPKDFAIYDLSNFLNVITLFQDPTLDFTNDNYVTIRSGSRYSKYYFSNPEITLKAAPNRDVKISGFDVQFDVAENDIKALKKAANIFNLEDMAIASVEGKVVATVCDLEDETSNTYEQSFQGDATGDFSVNMKVENLVLLPGDYEVSIATAGISQWKNKTMDLVYYIALEQ